MNNAKSNLKTTVKFYFKQYFKTELVITFTNLKTISTINEYSLGKDFAKLK